MPDRIEPPSGYQRDIDDRLLARRIVTVAGALDDATATRVAGQLLLLDREPGPVTLHLGCSEAELSAALALADTVDLVSAPVHTTVRGTLPAPALAVLCASDLRAAHRHAMFLLSLPRAQATGSATDVAGRAARHAHQVTQLSLRVADVTGRAPGEVAEELGGPGRLLTAEEARSFGLVQEVV
jgi:ATP-dependent Clp protease protease subunit